ncbi:MAG: TetR/AcrR family transcriptional regulator [Acidimicrobiia bacterium]
MSAAPGTGEAPGPVPCAGRGRPRSAVIDRAVRRAALELLVEQGYGGTSVEAIAGRAGVGKPAIYRRWPSKAAIVVDALRCHPGIAAPLPDTGDLRADVEVMLAAVQRGMAGGEGPVMAAFVAEKFRYPELRDEFERVFVRERREHLQRLVAGAVARGELPAGTDVDLVAEIGPALLAHRLLVRHLPPDPDLPRRIVDQLFGPG